MGDEASTDEGGTGVRRFALPMLIRQAQIEALGQQRAEDFQAALLRQLRALHPGHAGSLGEGELESFLQRVISVCRRHGLHSRGEISALCELMFQVGVDFENHCRPAWARQVLAHPALPGSAKVQLLARAIHEWTGGRVVVRQ